MFRAQGSKLVEGIVRPKTTRSNWGLLSLFETNVLEESVLVLGVAGQFIPLRGVGGGDVKGRPTGFLASGENFLAPCKKYPCLEAHGTVDNRLKTSLKPAPNLGPRLSPAYPHYSQVCHNILFDKKRRSLYLVGMCGCMRIRQGFRSQYSAPFSA